MAVRDHDQNTCHRLRTYSHACPGWGYDWVKAIDVSALSDFPLEVDCGTYIVYFQETGSETWILRRVDLGGEDGLSRVARDCVVGQMPVADLRVH